MPEETRAYVIMVVSIAAQPKVIELPIGGYEVVKIKSWCSETVTKVKSHKLIYLEAQAGTLNSAVTSVAAVVPDHYAAPDRLAVILRRLGKPAVADYVQTKLPQGAKSRSGDLGEILATSYVAEFTTYKVGVYKLRWSDHREMAMRGDDILGVQLDPTVGIKFLKGEVKSRVTLGKKTVDEARLALTSSNGRPTPHALAFVADRLFETGEIALAEVIDQFQLKTRIGINQVSHLMFMFTGNNPSKLLTENLNEYSGTIPQFAVGLRVASHQTFIKQVFEKVIDDGNKP